MLPESRLYSFLDQDSSYGIQFLEGQKLIQEMALIHNLNSSGFNALRDMLLSAQPLISLLKPGEGLGLYLDNEDPYVRFKLETNYEGALRTLLLPETLESFPEYFNGIARLTKLSPNSLQPYNSSIELKQTPSKSIINKILAESYQIPGSIELADNVDQAVMILQFPRPNVDKEELEERPSPNEYWLKMKSIIFDLFKKQTTDEAEIQSHFSQHGLLFLGSRQVKFQCSCSKERMVMGVAGLIHSEGYESVFGEGKNELEAKCDYCKSFYDITRQDVENHFLKINQ